MNRHYVLFGTVHLLSLHATFLTVICYRLMQLGKNCVHGPYVNSLVASFLVDDSQIAEKPD